MGTDNAGRIYESPEHLDYWARNDRLYKTLLGFGLYVEPIFVDEARTSIDHLRVSVGMPTQDMTKDSYLP